MCDTLAHRSLSKQAFRQINELKKNIIIKMTVKSSSFVCLRKCYLRAHFKHTGNRFRWTQMFRFAELPTRVDGYGDFGKSNNFMATKLLPNTFWRNEEKKDPQRLEICGTLFDLILIFLFEERWNDC